MNICSLIDDNTDQPLVLPNGNFYKIDGSSIKFTTNRNLKNPINFKAKCHINGCNDDSLFVQFSNTHQITANRERNPNERRLHKPIKKFNFQKRKLNPACDGVLTPPVTDLLATYPHDATLPAYNVYSSFTNSNAGSCPITECFVWKATLSCATDTPINTNYAGPVSTTGSVSPFNILVDRTLTDGFTAQSLCFNCIAGGSINQPGRLIKLGVYHSDCTLTAVSPIQYYQNLQQPITYKQKSCNGAKTLDLDLQFVAANSNCPAQNSFSYYEKDCVTPQSSTSAYYIDTQHYYFMQRDCIAAGYFVSLCVRGKSVSDPIGSTILFDIELLPNCEMAFTNNQTLPAQTLVLFSQQDYVLSTGSFPMFWDQSQGKCGAHSITGCEITTAKSNGNCEDSIVASNYATVGPDPWPYIIHPMHWPTGYSNEQDNILLTCYKCSTSNPSQPTVSRLVELYMPDCSVDSLALTGTYPDPAVLRQYPYSASPSIVTFSVDYTSFYTVLTDCPPPTSCDLQNLDGSAFTHPYLTVGASPTFALSYQQDYQPGYLVDFIYHCTNSLISVTTKLQWQQLIDCESSISQLNPLNVASYPQKIDYNNVVGSTVIWNTNGHTDLFSNLDSAQCPLTTCAIKSADCSAGFTGTYISVGGDPFVVSFLSDFANGWIESFCFECTYGTIIRTIPNISIQQIMDCNLNLQTVSSITNNPIIVPYDASLTSNIIIDGIGNFITIVDQTNCGGVTGCEIWDIGMTAELDSSITKLTVDPGNPFAILADQSVQDGNIVDYIFRCYYDPLDPGQPRIWGNALQRQYNQKPDCSLDVQPDSTISTDYKETYSQANGGLKKIQAQSFFKHTKTTCPLQPCCDSTFTCSVYKNDCSSPLDSLDQSRIFVDSNGDFNMRVDDLAGYSIEVCLKCVTLDDTDGSSSLIQVQVQHCQDIIAPKNPQTINQDTILQYQPPTSIINWNTNPLDIFYNQDPTFNCPITSCSLLQTDCINPFTSGFISIVPATGIVSAISDVSIGWAQESFCYKCIGDSLAPFSVEISNRSIKQMRDCITQNFLPVVIASSGIANPIEKQFDTNTQVTLIQQRTSLLTVEDLSYCGDITGCELWDISLSSKLDSSITMISVGLVPSYPIVLDSFKQEGNVVDYIYRCYQDPPLHGAMRIWGNSYPRKFIQYPDCSQDIQPISGTSSFTEHYNIIGTKTLGLATSFFQHTVTSCATSPSIQASCCSTALTCSIYQEDCSNPLDLLQQSYIFIDGLTDQLTMKTDIEDGYQIKICLKCTSSSDTDGSTLVLDIQQYLNCESNIKQADKQVNQTQILSYNNDYTVISQGFNDRIFKLLDESICGTPDSCQIVNGECSSSDTNISPNIEYISNQSPWGFKALTNKINGWNEQSYCYQCIKSPYPYQNFQFTLELFDCSSSYQVTYNFNFDMNFNDTDQLKQITTGWNKFITNQNPEYCPDPTQCILKYQNCSVIYSNTLVQVDPLNSFSIMAVQNIEYGWEEELCLFCSYHDLKLSSLNFSIKQKRDCRNNLLHHINQRNQTLILPFGPPDFVISQAWNDSIFDIMFPKECGEIQKCELKQQDCQTNLTSYQQKHVQMKESHPWQILANTSFPQGWVEQICYQCFQTSSNKSIQFKIQISQVDCSQSYLTNEKFISKNSIFPYRNTSIEQTYFDRFDEVFLQNDYEQCPNITVCNLFKEDCVEPYKGSNINMQQEQPWSLKYKTNIVEGWQDIICFQCKSDALTIQLVKVIAQTPDPATMIGNITQGLSQINITNIRIEIQNLTKNESKEDETKEDKKDIVVEQRIEKEKIIESKLSIIAQKFRYQQKDPNLMDIDIEQRNVSLRIVKILPDGQVDILFSERLLDKTDFESMGITLEDLNFVKHKIFDVQYHSSLNSSVSDMFSRRVLQQASEDQEIIIPQLQNWTITDFQDLSMKLQLNFSDPMYVSSGERPDIFQVKVLKNNLFLARFDFLPVDQNYTVSQYIIYGMGDKEEMQSVVTATNAIQKALVISQAIPFLFMIFMSFGMEKVWGLYLMLQIAGNINSFDRTQAISDCLIREIELGIPEQQSNCPYPLLRIPSNCKIVTTMIQELSNFKITQSPYVKQFMKEYIFGRAKWIQDFISEQILLTSMIAVCVMFLIIFGLIKLNKTPKLVKALKEKMMYSSIFRGQIQFFFPQCLICFMILTQCHKQENQGNPECINYGFGSIIMSSIKLAFFLFIPVFSLIHLRRHYNFLEDKDFKKKFETLYTNLYPKKHTVYIQMTFFCVKRMIIAFITVAYIQPISFSIFLYTELGIFTIGYILNNRPFMTKILNIIEIVNEYFIVVTGYYMIIFSEWFYNPNKLKDAVAYDEPMLRYQQGYVYIVNLCIILAFNFYFIIKEQGQSMKKMYRKHIYYKKWGTYYKIKIFNHVKQKEMRLKQLQFEKEQKIKSDEKKAKIELQERDQNKDNENKPKFDMNLLDQQFRKDLKDRENDFYSSRKNKLNAPNTTKIDQNISSSRDNTSKTKRNNSEDQQIKSKRDDSQGKKKDKYKKEKKEKKEKKDKDKSKHETRFKDKKQEKKNNREEKKENLQSLELKYDESGQIDYNQILLKFDSNLLQKESLTLKNLKAYQKRNINTLDSYNDLIKIVKDQLVDVEKQQRELVMKIINSDFPENIKFKLKQLVFEQLFKLQKDIQLKTRLYEKFKTVS